MEDVLILGMVFGFCSFVCAGIYKLIRAKIDQGHGVPDEAFDRMARAFIQHKKDTEKRLQNLEAIVTEEEAPSKSGQQKLDKPHRTIEIDDEESRSQSKEEGGNLRNMLRE